LIVREIPTEITCHPELRTIKGCIAVVSLIDSERSIEATKVFCRRAVTFVAGVSSRFGAIEIARAGIRTTTSLDNRGIE